MISSDSKLLRLKNADLIRRLLGSDLAYQFKHNLIQESAYESLLRHDRRNLHRATARALENAYPQELDGNAALLAKHYAEAGDEEKTYGYARRAGDVARRLSAYQEALMQYDTAALLAPRLQVPTAEFVELHQARGRTLELMGKHDDAREAYRALYDLGHKRNDSLIKLGALLALATLQLYPNETQNLQAALEANQQALELARASADAASETRALWNMVLYEYFSGRANDSIRYGNEGLALADKHGLTELRAYILNDMSRAIVSAASVPDALRTLEQARAIWTETQNLPMLADNLATTCELSFISGDLGAFERFYQEAVDLCHTIGNDWNLSYVQGTRLQLKAYQGDFESFVRGVAQVKKLALASGFGARISASVILEAMMMGELGAPAGGLAHLEHNATLHSFQFLELWRFGIQSYLYTLLGEMEQASRDLARARAGLLPNDLSNYGPIFIALCGAELDLALGNPAAAVRETEQPILRLRAAHVKYLLPELFILRTRGLLELGQHDAAEQDLQNAEEVARAMQDRPGLWQIFAYRAKLETMRGNAEGARAARFQARALVEWIAEHSPQEYRDSFLVRPLVQYVFDAD